MTLNDLPARDRRRRRHGDKDCRTPGCCWTVDDLGALAETVAA
jgi:hypothetical protein